VARLAGWGRVARLAEKIPAGGHPPLVNWDVVTEDWHGLELNLRGLGENIERGWKKIAG